MVTTFDYEDSRLERFNVTVPLRRMGGDLYSFVLDISADRFGAKELAMNAVVLSCGTSGWAIFMHRVWMFYASETAPISHSRGPSWTATFAPWGKLNSLLTPRQPATRSAGLST